MSRINNDDETQRVLKDQFEEVKMLLQQEIKKTAYLQQLIVSHNEKHVTEQNHIHQLQHENTQLQSQLAAIPQNNQARNNYIHCEKGRELEDVRNIKNKINSDIPSCYE